MAGKRGNGEGSIYQRADGLWCASVTVGFDDTGKQKRKTLYGKTRKDVAAKIQALQAAQVTGVPVSRRDVTVSALLVEYLADCKPRLRPKTYQSYELLAQTHIAPRLGRVKLADLDAQVVDRMQRELLATGLSAQTVLLTRAVLRRAVDMAVRWDWVGRNVVDLASAPRVPRRVPPMQSVEQAQAILAAFDGHRFSPLITLIIGMGLRIGEALGLRWADVKFVDGRPLSLVVGGQLQFNDGEYQLVPLKSEQAVRTLFLPDFVADALAAQKRAADTLAEGWVVAGLTNTLGLVFTNYQAGPLEYQNVRRDCMAVLKRAGIEGVRLHDLRHLCASILIAKNVNPRVVMEILGHSQISLTMNTYSHVMPGVAAGAANAMHEAMKGSV